MSTTKVELTTCDLCGYGGQWAAVNDFVRRGGYDFCVWCAGDNVETSMSCGGHEVMFVADGSAWVCTCRSTFGTAVVLLRFRGVSQAVMDAVPNLARATALAHVQS